MSFPPYACSCCGVTNGDMFYDYFNHLGKEPTPDEIAEFNGYRKAWYGLKALSEDRVTRSAKPANVGFHHSEKTRQKIAESQRKRYAKGTKGDK